jgi:hypothetical protein
MRNHKNKRKKKFTAIQSDTIKSEEMLNQLNVFIVRDFKSCKLFLVIFFLFQYLDENNEDLYEYAHIVHQPPPKESLSPSLSQLNKIFQCVMEITKVKQLDLGTVQTSTRYKISIPLFQMI